jgi:sugar phosphate isomerase/epimerase
MKLSCVTASYVADLINYPGEVDWDLAAHTIETSPILETMDGMLKRLAPARLDGIEPWFPHLGGPKAKNETLLASLKEKFAAAGLVCAACAGDAGDPIHDPENCERPFQIAKVLGAPLIAAHADPKAVAAISKICEKYQVALGFENGGEGDVSEILEAINQGNQWVGSNLDTGNFANSGGDPVKAVRVLGKRINHVHFKDVTVAGSGHCISLGQGIVDVRGVMRELKAIGYNGWLSIEIETVDHDPTAEIIESANFLRSLF